MLGPKFSAPLALDVPEDLVDFRVRGASAFGEADNSRAAFIGCVGPHDMPESVEAPKKLVHGLLAHAGALGEHARADPIRARKLQHRHHPGAVTAHCEPESLIGLDDSRLSLADQEWRSREAVIGIYG